MILANLTVTDFGIFRGSQTINLAPRPHRPVVLFGGKNGAGKSTLLEAIRLCLYGAGMLGARSSKEEYLRYLDSKIHSNPNCLIQPTFASIAIEFRYGGVQGLSTFRVTRSWERRNGSRIVEDLSVERDGRPLDDIAAEHWQDFIRGLIPPGVSQLFFFDGEKIQQLAENTTDQQTLADAVKSLLGLDTVERLQSDLRIYLSRLVKPSANGQHAREIAELEQESTRSRRALDNAMSERQQKEAKLVELKSAVAHLEDKIASQGGSFARNREELLGRHTELKASIQQREGSIREFCGGLLPFALASALCTQLKDQLLREEQAKQVQASGALLKSAKERIAKRIRADDLWAGLGRVSDGFRKELRARFLRVVEDALRIEQTSQIDLVHDLSLSESRRLLSWIDQATGELPKKVRLIANDLEHLYREYQQTEEALRKIPADEVLKPLMLELHDLHRQLAEVGKAVLLKDEEIRSTQHKLGELQRRYETAAEELAAQASSASRLHTVPHIQKVLEEFGTALIDRKVAQLEGAVTEYFNVLCRKKDELRRITVDPKDFSVTLFDKRNRPLPKAQLSAGEKQIYAISVLWALARTSGRPLPMIIDTPLARLDTDHRNLLVQHYFPVASHQVLILSTDTEVDQSYFSKLRPAIAHSYQLEFSPEENSTTIRPGYFWGEAHATH